MVDHHRGQAELWLADDSCRRAVLGAAVPSAQLGGAPLASPEGLVALKVKAAKQNRGRRAKDIPDIVGLWLLHSLQLDAVEPFLDAGDLAWLEGVPPRGEHRAQRQPWVAVDLDGTLLEAPNPASCAAIGLDDQPPTSVRGE